jgi:hypothetical protein
MASDAHGFFLDGPDFSTGDVWLAYAGRALPHFRCRNRTNDSSLSRFWAAPAQSTIWAGFDAPISAVVMYADSIEHQNP